MSLKNPKSFEWKILYAVSGVVDAIQLFIDLVGTEFLAAPEIINEIADPIIGVIIALYFQLRGVSMVKRISRLGSLIGGYFAEAVTASVAPAWIVDVWYIHSTVRQEWEEKQAAAQPEDEEDLPANRMVDGKAMRVPPRNKPANENGIRNPAPPEETYGYSRGNRRGDIVPKSGTTTVGKRPGNDEMSLAA